MVDPLLKLENVNINFGGLKAVNRLNMELYPGELIGLIGPNGAGKTTVFNLLTGIYVPTEGTITFNGERINNIPPYKINQKGISRTFQNIRLFGDLTVLDNVKIAYHTLAKQSIFSSIFRLPKHHAEEAKMEREAIKFLKLFDLHHLQNEKAKNLPYGMQRRLEIARALAAHPKLLLLDEPAAGMNPKETLELMDLIAYIRREFDLTVLLIEHDMRFVMGICERIYVLDHGKCIATGTPEEIRKNPRVIKAYLGEEAISLHA